MKTTLIMATTVNGFIAGLDDDTNWVKDTELLYKMVADFGVVVLGRRTYEECVKYNAFPYKGALNIVLTHDSKYLSIHQDQVFFTDKNPLEIIQVAQERGFERLLLIGGGHINGSFMQAGCIDEIVLDVHPLVKSKGIHLFESEFADFNLELTEFKQLSDQILQIRYAVKK